MEFRSLGLILADPDGDAPALDAALALARQWGAHLDIVAIGVDATIVEPVVTGGIPLVFEAGLADARERADAVARWAEGRIPAGFTACAVEPVVVPQAGIEDAIARLGRFADLTVASRPYGKNALPLHAAIFEAALFRGGTPILVVPETGLPDGFPGGPVVAAWDESEQALVAIRAALPLLAAASVVHVAMVDPPSHAAGQADPGSPLCLMLARHDVRAEVSILARTLPSIAETLLRFAHDREATALVIGGYGHSRLRERMFGGVTRDLVQASDLPVLVAR